MKVTSSWQSARRCALILTIVAGWSMNGMTAPPPAPVPKEEDPNFFKKMGSFLFKKTRDFEKSQEPPKALPPPTAAQPKPRTGRRPQTSDGAASQPIPGVNSGRRGDTQYLREDPSNPGTGSDGGERSNSGSSKSKSDKGAGATEKTAGSSEIMGPPAPLSYAVPVAGRAGFVYPPGAERNEANMLDVRGLAPGQKARDPRTGNTFLVP
jgi:hypothetical protein